MKKESKNFKRVDKPSDRKLRFEGFCSKCNKVMPHRWDGGSLSDDRYRCIKCKNITVEESVYVKNHRLGKQERD